MDQQNTIGKAYDLKFVPVGILVDEEGRLVRTVGGANIYDDSFREELESWAVTGTIPVAWREGSGPISPRSLLPEEAEADARFQLAIVLLDRGNREGAVNELKKAMRLDPKNWLIRKQLWAIETPEAFYSGKVDYAWQKEQIRREDAEIAERE